MIINVPTWLNKIVSAFLILCLLVLFFFIEVTPVFALSIVVDIPYDEDEDNGHCSLREAIQAAINQADYNGCTAGATAFVTLLEDIYTVDSTLPSINAAITIRGRGPSETIIQASSCVPTKTTCSQDYELFYIASTGDLSLENLTVRNSQSQDLYGSAIRINYEGILDISNCVFKNNLSRRGGVIFNYGSLTITDSTFSTNEARNASGTPSGGVIYNQTLSTTIIERSTFSGNSAANGGAIRNDGTLTILNSTFSGNVATDNGGAIYNSESLIITNSTFSENTADTSNGAGIYNNNDGTLEFTNTIIANSTAGWDCANDGVISVNVNNLIGSGNCPALYGSVLLVLGSLADNGGPTQTHALIPGSFGIDKGDAAACPATDQRGVVRPQGDGCDLGAFEVLALYLPLVLR